MDKKKKKLIGETVNFGGQTTTIPQAFNAIQSKTFTSSNPDYSFINGNISPKMYTNPNHMKILQEFSMKDIKNTYSIPRGSAFNIMNLNGLKQSEKEGTKLLRANELGQLWSNFWKSGAISIWFKPEMTPSDINSISDGTVPIKDLEFIAEQINKAKTKGSRKDWLDFIRTEARKRSEIKPNDPFRLLDNASRNLQNDQKKKIKSSTESDKTIPDGVQTLRKFFNYTSKPFSNKARDKRNTKNIEKESTYTPPGGEKKTTKDQVKDQVNKEKEKKSENLSKDLNPTGEPEKNDVINLFGTKWKAGEVAGTLGDLVYTQYAFGTRAAVTRAIQLGASSIVKKAIPLLALGLGSYGLLADVALTVASPILVNMAIGKFANKYLGKDIADEKREKDKEIKLVYSINVNQNANVTATQNINLSLAFNNSTTKGAEIAREMLGDTFDKIAGTVKIPDQIIKLYQDMDRNITTDGKLVLSFYPSVFRIAKIFGTEQLDKFKISSFKVLPLYHSVFGFDQPSQFQLVPELLTTLTTMFGPIPNQPKYIPNGTRDLKEISYILKGADLYIRERLIRSGEKSNLGSSFGIDINIRQVAEIKASGSKISKEQQQNINKFSTEEEKIKNEEKAKRKESLEITQDVLIALIMTFGKDFQVGVTEELFRLKKEAENLKGNANTSWEEMVKVNFTILQKLNRISTLVGQGTSAIENPVIKSFLSKCFSVTLDFIGDIINKTEEYLRDILIKKIKDGTRKLYGHREFDKNGVSYNMLLELLTLRHNGGNWTVWKETDQDGFLFALRDSINAVKESNKSTLLFQTKEEKKRTISHANSILGTKDNVDVEFNYFRSNVITNPNIFGFANSTLITQMDTVYQRTNILEAFTDEQVIKSLPSAIKAAESRLGVFNRRFSSYSLNELEK